MSFNRPDVSIEPFADITQFEKYVNENFDGDVRTDISRYLSSATSTMIAIANNPNKNLLTQWENYIKKYSDPAEIYDFNNVMSDADYKLIHQAACILSLHYYNNGIRQQRTSSSISVAGKQTSESSGDTRQIPEEFWEIMRETGYYQSSFGSYTTTETISATPTPTYNNTEHIKLTDRTESFQTETNQKEWNLTAKTKIESNSANIDNNLLNIDDNTANITKNLTKITANEQKTSNLDTLGKVVFAPREDRDIATKKYVDDNSGGGSTDLPFLVFMQENPTEQNLWEFLRTNNAKVGSLVLVNGRFYTIIVYDDRPAGMFYLWSPQRHLENNKFETETYYLTCGNEGNPLNPTTLKNKVHGENVLIHDPYGAQGTHNDMPLNQLIRYWDGTIDDLANPNLWQSIIGWPAENENDYSGVYNVFTKHTWKLDRNRVNRVIYNYDENTNSDEITYKLPVKTTKTDNFADTELIPQSKVKELINASEMLVFENLTATQEELYRFIDENNPYRGERIKVNGSVYQIYDTSALETPPIRSYFLVGVDHWPSGNSEHYNSFGITLVVKSDNPAMLNRTLGYLQIHSNQVIMGGSANINEKAMDEVFEITGEDYDDLIVKFPMKTEKTENFNDTEFIPQSEVKKLVNAGGTQPWSGITWIDDNDFIELRVGTSATVGDSAVEQDRFGIKNQRIKYNGVGEFTISGTIYLENSSTILPNNNKLFFCTRPFYFNTIHTPNFFAEITYRADRDLYYTGTEWTYNKSTHIFSTDTSEHTIYQIINEAVKSGYFSVQNMNYFAPTGLKFIANFKIYTTENI